MDFRNVIVMLFIFFVAAFYGAFMMGGIDLPDLDLFGNVERARIEADAAVRVAELESQASVEVAQTWADVLPLLIVLVVVGVLAAIVLYWRGQIALEQARRQSLMLQPGDPGFYSALRQAARQHNAQIEIDKGRYYLVTHEDSYEVKALPVKYG